MSKLKSPSNEDLLNEILLIRKEKPGIGIKKIEG